MTRSISRPILALSLALLSWSPSPRTNLGVIVSIPSRRALARIAPATSPTPVIARAVEAQRHAHRPWRKPAAALRAHIDEASVVELQGGGGQPVGIARGRVRAVERPQHADVPAGHVGEERRRPKQVDAQAQVAITPSARSTAPLATARRAAEPSGQLAAQDSVVERRVADHLHRRRRQPHEPALQELRRRQALPTGRSDRRVPSAAAERSAVRTC